MAFGFDFSQGGGSQTEVFGKKFFKDIFQQGQQAIGDVRGRTEGLMAQPVQQVGRPGQPFLRNLQQRAQGENPFLQQQIDALQTDFGNLFRQQILPGIQGEAVSVGGVGGARQGIAQGLAAEGIAQEFGQAAGNLRFQAFGQGTEAARAGLAGSLAQPGAQQAQLNLGMAQAGLPFLPLQLQAGILGSPTPMTEREGTESIGLSF